MRRAMYKNSRFIRRKLLLLAGGFVVPFAHALELELPIALVDAGYLAYGVAPFGYHVAEHRYDGHPGIDIEFMPGRKVRAAHAGAFRYTVDSHDPSLKTVTIEFQEEGINYQLFYTNIGSLEEGIDNGVEVASGQIFGTPGEVVRNLGSAGSFTYAMTHFQLADNRSSYGLSNFSAISPEPYFDAESRQVLAQIWEKSQYHQMICEPYFSTSRGVSPNPTIIRRWIAEAGSAATDIEFSCDFSLSDPNNSYQYRLISGMNTTLEAGAVVVTASVGGVSEIDLYPEGASPRLGALYVKDGTMDLAYSEPGGSRPVDLTNAMHYSSESAASCANATDAVCFKGNAAPYMSGDRLNLSLEIDWTKLSDAPLSDTSFIANLWLALQLPSGEILFRHADEQWSQEPQPFWEGISELDSGIAIIDTLVPPDSGPAGFIFYALLTASTPGDEDLAVLPLSNLASTLIYLAP